MIVLQHSRVARESLGNQIAPFGKVSKSVHLLYPHCARVSLSNGNTNAKIAANHYDGERS